MVFGKIVEMAKTSNWLSCALLSACFSSPVWAHPDAAHVQADNAWARVSVPGQQATGAFVQLTAKEPLRLVGVETTVAGSGEIHEMKMDGDVMRMRAVDGLDLPQGQLVELKPGGYHIMFQQLKAPLAEGSEVPMTLVFKDAKGETSRLHLQVPVQRMAPAAGHAGHAMPAAHGAGHGH
jgi:periplasmic copper chaperone A